MGNFLNPGNNRHREHIKKRHYVDKSGLVSFINDCLENEGDCCFCVTRPRRFGKSYAADMLTAYYGRGCDSHALFEGYKAATSPYFETHINKYNLIRINMAKYIKSFSADTAVIYILDRLVETITSEIREEYPDVTFKANDTLPEYFNNIYMSCDIPFVFIVDEWDAVFRVRKDDLKGQTEYMNLLESLFKDSDFISFVYMTGILPIKKYCTGSELNMFREYSMLKPGSVRDFIGFTEEEVEKLCAGSEFTKQNIKDWYDGYKLGGIDIYNSNSVVSALREGELTNYWTDTEMFEDLLSYIRVNVDGLHDVILKLLAKERFVLPSYKAFKNDLSNLKGRDEHLIALIHLGYLSYDSRDGTLKIPNHEIRIQFVDSLGSMKRSIVAKFYDYSNKLLDATIKADAKGVAEMLGRIFAELTKRTAYPYENAFGDFVDFAYMCANDYYDVIPEAPTRWLKKADFVLYPNFLRARKGKSYLPGIIIELKNEKSAKEAADQIEEKGYDDYFEYRGYEGDIIHIGLDFKKLEPEEREALAAMKTVSEDDVSVGNDANLNKQSNIVHFSEIRKYTI